MIQQLALPDLDQLSWIYLPGNRSVTISAGTCESYACDHENDPEGDFCDLTELEEHETLIDALTEYCVSTRIVYVNSNSQLASIQLEIPGSESTSVSAKMQFTVDLSYSALAYHLGTQYRMAGIDYIQSFAVPVTSTFVTYPDGETFPEDNFTHVIWDDEPFERIEIIGSAPQEGLEVVYTIHQNSQSEMLLKIDPERLQGFLNSIDQYGDLNAA